MPPAPLQPDYASAPVVVGRPKKPVSVLVLSIIGIVIGGFSVLCSPLSMVSMLVDFGVPNPQLDAVKQDPLLKAWFWFAIVQMLFFGIWLLVASVGAVAMKRWGRSSMVLYAIVQTTLSVAGWVANFVLIRPRTAAAMQGMGTAATPVWQEAIGWVVGAAVLAYLISVWYVFSRPHIIDAYDAAEAAAV
jgi:hypothetical protein